MVKTIYIDGNDLYLSKNYLKSFTTIKTIEAWNKIDEVYKIKVESDLFYLYQSIPKRTRKKLQSADKIISQESKKHIREKLAELMHDSFYFGYTKYSKIYEADNILKAEQVTKCCQLHSAFQIIIDLKRNEGFRDLKILFDVFNHFFPGKYKSKHALSNAVRKATAESIMSVALDKRVFGNNNEQTNKKLGPVTQYWMTCLTAHPRKFSNPKILELITIACNEKNYKAPSLSWVKKQRRKLLKENTVIYGSRYGQSELNKKLPTASLIHAKFANDQWQMDGWTLPFWSKGEKYVQRYVLVRLIDYNSKKIVGYSVGKSENTLLIMEAIRDAINNTGILPFEILTDNHSFHETNEAKSLIEMLSRKGSRWTVTQNPQHKSIVERYNQDLDNLCKGYYGYIGKGIRSKSIEALAKPEMIDQYIKNLIPEEEIKIRAAIIVKAYNEKKRSNGKSPNELYVQNENPNPIIPSLFDRSEIGTMTTEKQIRNGQITFNKGIEKHRFVLPAKLYSRYNDAIVKVCYDDLREGIYIFDKITNEGIDFLSPKEKINGAKVNQTEDDIHKLNKHKGRITGIKSKATKELNQIRDKALDIDPEAYERVNALTTPKDVIQEMESDASARRFVESKGINTSTVHIPARFNPGVTTALQPKKREKDPFSAKGNEIKIIDPKKYLNDD